jgi:UDP-2,3-diacylglucosamine pyrophosphatase LpxH
MNSRENTISENRKLFIVSDLHIGDGSSRDNLIKDNKIFLFNRFLDEVEKQDGSLLILGDLLELWRYPLDAILQRWWKLFDRLSEMNVVYVPGNHDELLDLRYANDRTMHPFFQSLQQPFYKTIGCNRFKFMHGHEVDPLISRHLRSLAPFLRLLAGTLEFGSSSCLITSDRVTDILLEAGEQFLHIWHTLTRQVNHAVYSHLGFSGESLTCLKCPIRTRNMLARFYKQQGSGVYDITVTGHTHKAGHFRDWYFNCGSWTQHIMNYLIIYPDGWIEVRNWTAEGSTINTASVA